MQLLSKTLRVITAFFVITLIVLSCKKETSDTLTPQDEENANVFATEADAESEDVFNSVFDDIMGPNDTVGFGSTGIFGRAAITNDQNFARLLPLPSCLVITRTHLTADYFPITITLDYGNGCLCADGHVRGGQIITTYTGRLREAGSSATTTFHNYYSDSVHLDNASTFTISNTGTQNILQFTVDVHAKVVKPNSNYHEWHSHKIFTRFEGASTITPLDDIFRIEGSATGKVKRGDVIVAWRSEIIEPLMKRFNCRWISKGKVSIARANLATNSQWIGSLNYGNGLCDNHATLIINGIPHEITLH